MYFFVCGYLAHLRSRDIRSLKEYSEWRTTQKISAIYKIEKNIAQKVLVFPAQYDLPSKYWKNFFATKDNNTLDELFYLLKIWIFEHDLK